MVGLKTKAVEAKRRCLNTSIIRDGFAQIPLKLSYIKENETVAHPQAFDVAFNRIVSHISTSSPKTLRIARRITQISGYVGYFPFVKTFSSVFMDNNGKLKQGNLDKLLGNFYDELQAIARETFEKGGITIAKMAQLAGITYGSGGKQ